jgi:hypothetical protein
MNLLAHFPRIVVATWGRSGSIWLSHDIGVALNTDPVMQNLTTAQSFNTTDPWPIQTHINVEPELLEPYSVIFCVRKHSAETVLSSVLARHYDLWHNMASNPIATPEPFEFKNWQQLESLCRNYVGWHKHYQSVLKQNHNRFVVVFEDMLARRSISKMYLPIYTDKPNYIKNYSQVQEFVEMHTDAMQQAITPYLDFENSVDIIDVLNSVDQQ